MPTGYTAVIKDGTTFEQFALTCARAFGACISMRDLPNDAPFPESFEPDAFHEKALAAAREELRKWEALDIKEAGEQCDLEYHNAEADRVRRLAENKATLERYRTHLVRVRAWEPPSAEHIGLRDFMAQQLEDSIKWDDSTEYLSKPTPVQTAVEWLEAKKAKALADIRRHTEKHKEELERTAQRNEWVRTLRESLK